MKDGLDRTGYIADNYQFQFDGPPQVSDESDRYDTH